MHRRCVIGVSLGLLGLFEAVTASAQTPAVTAFVNVSVIPMDRERVLARQTVLVQGDRILKLGPVGQVQVPANATRIDGTGKYLLPGLEDMHVHIVDDDLGAFEILARGVTTVREMLAGPATLELKGRIASGEIVGPRIYTATIPSNCEFPDLAKCVAGAKAAGYDFIKFYETVSSANLPSPDSLGRQAFDSLVAAARRVGIRISGHMQIVGIEWALRARVASAEHAYGYAEYATGSTPGGALDTTRRLDPAKLSEIAAATRQAGTWVVPTLAIVAAFNGVELSNLNTATRYRLQVVKALHDAGAGLLLGTDYGPVLGELEWLVLAGLTPYQALETGTRNPAVFLGTLDQSGTVEAGKNADLVLLRENPLEDINHVADVAGVMVRGQWLPREELDKQRRAIDQGP